MENIFVEFLPPWVETGLQPAFYDKESGTVLQQTARMYARVNMLIRMFNKLSKNTKETVEEYINKFNELHDYVQDYFDNLDVQEEINNKIDAMVEDGTFSEVLGIYPELEGEVGVVANFYTYGDVYRYGAKCDGTTDDTTALNNAITNALAFGIPVRLHGKIYVSETINTHGALLVGDKQPKNSGVFYPNGIGYDYARNKNDGALITFSDYINTIPDGTCIISDVASPILSTDYNKEFKLENFGVYGWLRNTSQVGIEVNTDAEADYYPGRHMINNFSVFNTGSHAIHLRSIETTSMNNVIVELTNGYGIYIHGEDGVDTPVDYVEFVDCRVRHTRLHAIYIYKSARKNITFKHCDFTYTGQYDFGSVNDTYGDRTFPLTTNNIIYAICINYLNSVSSEDQLRNLVLIDNWGEKCIGFLYTNNINTVVNITCHNNMFTKGFNTSVNCYWLSSTKYIEHCDFDHAISNFDTLYDLPNIYGIKTASKIPNQLYSAVSSVLYKNANKSGYNTFLGLYGDTLYAKNVVIPQTDYTYYNASTGSSQTVEIDATEIVNQFMKANQATVHGQSFALGLLSLSNGGDSSTAPVSDLVTFTRHNSKYYVGFVTNNTGATADTTGKITITVPAWKIATLQMIQQVSTDVQ